MAWFFGLLSAFLGLALVHMPMGLLGALIGGGVMFAATVASL